MKYHTLEVINHYHHKIKRESKVWKIRSWIMQTRKEFKSNNISKLTTWGCWTTLWVMILWMIDSHNFWTFLNRNNLLIILLLLKIIAMRWVKEGVEMFDHLDIYTRNRLRCSRKDRGNFWVSSWILLKKYQTRLINTQPTLNKLNNKWQKAKTIKVIILLKTYRD